MGTLEKVYSSRINLTTGKTEHYEATLTSQPDKKHKTYSILYEAYRSEWTLSIND